MAKNRRKTLIVNRLQYRLIGYILLLIILVSLILVAASLILFRKEVFAPNKCVFVQLSVITIVALILYLLSWRLLLLLSNKIYGPLYRLSNYIQKLGTGEDTGNLVFRKGDIIDGVAQSYDKLYNTLRKVLRYDYKELIRTFSELEDILDRIHKKDISELELFDRLQNICSRIAKALDITSPKLRE
ncbi:MAG: hypothetical protein ABIL70_03285 [candidate division WOR-3 bacterium]